MQSPANQSLFPKELGAIVSLWLIAVLCLGGKMNSFQKYWTSRHHTSLPVQTQLQAFDANAQETLDNHLQSGTLAFLSRQDPEQFAPAPAPTPVPAIAATASAPRGIALRATALPGLVLPAPASLATSSAAPAPGPFLSPVMMTSNAGPTAAGTEAGAKVDANTSAAVSEWVPNYAVSDKLTLSRGDKILFAGDSLMQGLVPYITRGLRGNGFRRYLDASKQSTGLSYPATFDWPGKIKTAIEKDDVNTVIIFIGANDAWSLASGGKLYSFGSAAWKLEYTRRVRELVQFAHMHKARVMWLELPPMHYDNLTKARDVLNTIYRQVAQEESALFMPTAQIVNDDEEKFNLFKKFGDGKIAQTRTDDGVHFTRLGQTLISRAVLQHINVQEDIRHE